jgi:protein dithiol:quinone oxidoreductase
MGERDRVRMIGRLSLMPRVGYAAGFLACAGLIGFALYLQHYEYQDPCPLCILQRIGFMALMAIFLVAALHGPGRVGAIVYGALLLTVAGIGAAVATRHVWLQHLPRNQIPECGPGLEFMLNKYPLAQALQKVLAGSGECAEAGWTFLGLSIAGWSLAWFVVLGMFAVYLTLLELRTRHQKRI